MSWENENYAPEAGAAEAAEAAEANGNMHNAEAAGARAGANGNMHNLEIHRSKLVSEYLQKIINIRIAEKLKATNNAEKWRKSEVPLLKIKRARNGRTPIENARILARQVITESNLRNAEVWAEEQMAREQMAMNGGKSRKHRSRKHRSRKHRSRKHRSRRGPN